MQIQESMNPSVQSSPFLLHSKSFKALSCHLSLELAENRPNSMKTIMTFFPDLTNKRMFFQGGEKCYYL